MSSLMMLWQLAAIVYVAWSTALPRAVALSVSVVQQQQTGLSATGRRSLSPNDDASRPELHLHRLFFNDTHRTTSDLKQFYRKNYRKQPAAKPGHVQYSLVDNTTCGQSRIVASVRLSNTAQEGTEWIFLRSLCVGKEYRRQGLGLKLLSEALDHFFQENRHRIRGTYCFAEPHLAPLYTRAGFQRFTWDPPSGAAKRKLPLPSMVQQQFARIRGKIKHQDLDCFLWQPVQILLLQHDNELYRNRTNTGQLLFDTRHLRITRQTWGGRADNEKVERSIRNAGKCVLLWTSGTNDIVAASSSSSDTKGTLPTFILLDGTWQEAQSMYRKLAYLLAPLPTLTLRPKATSSKYRLRKNYGWRSRFEDHPKQGTTSYHSLDKSPPNKDGGDLMCTVEVVAELLDSLEFTTGANLLHNRLDSFQECGTF